ncbi:MAG TPA: YaiI/YqxD family protein [Planctomycetaceae bacterium]|nr:YaiI/YqxD family protein [Planctomycetaceae bacterium]
MTIWVDADACPGEVKSLLYKAALRCRIPVVLVANAVLNPPKSEFISTVLVPQGMNIADRKIVELAQPGDLVITADVPLAADVVAKGATALDPRGMLYTRETVGARLASRNLMDNLRGEGVITGGGPSNYAQKERQAFANNLDRWLAKQPRPS